MSTRVERLDPEREPDFRRVHDDEHGLGWCHCVAWWTEDWERWGERTAEENRALREDLFRRGEHDGYLAYREDRPVGWCQVGRRDRLTKLVREAGLEPDEGAWAITCFAVVPAERRRGVARGLLAHALADLDGRGVPRVEAFPRTEEGEAGELWTGPAALFRSFGFRCVARGERRSVWRLELGDRDSR